MFEIDGREDGPGGTGPDEGSDEAPSLPPRPVDPERIEVGFELGRVVATRGLLAELDPLGVARLVARHARGDWGDLELEDKQANERALLEGERLLSSYWVESPADPATELHVYVITEWDRSVTTALLSAEY